MNIAYMYHLSLRTESLAFCNTLRMIKSFFFVFCWLCFVVLFVLLFSLFCCSLCFVVLFVLLLALFLGIKGG